MYDGGLLIVTLIMNRLGRKRVNKLAFHKIIFADIIVKQRNIVLNI